MSRPWHTLYSIADIQMPSEPLSCRDAQWHPLTFSIEIALYGKAYIQAAKDTWRLMKDRGG